MNTLTEETRPEGEMEKKMGSCRISLNSTINFSITDNVNTYTNTYVIIQCHFFVTVQFEEMAAAGLSQHMMCFFIAYVTSSTESVDSRN